MGCETGKESQLHDRGRSGIGCFELLQSLVEGQHIEPGPRQCRLDLRQVEAPAFATCLETGFVPGLVDQNPPHGLGSGGEEVPPALPFLGSVPIHKPDVGLMNQGRGLECLARLLVG